MDAFQQQAFGVLTPSALAALGTQTP
jgi:hypothetical protein